MPHETLYSTSIYISDDEIARLVSSAPGPQLSRRATLSTLVHRAADLVREGGPPSLHCKRKVTSISCSREDFNVLSKTARESHASFADILLATLEA